jgi:hypothetical protein
MDVARDQRANVQLSRSESIREGEYAQCLHASLRRTYDHVYCLRASAMRDPEGRRCMRHHGAGFAHRRGRGTAARDDGPLAVNVLHDVRIARSSLPALGNASRTTPAPAEAPARRPARVVLSSRSSRSQFSARRRSRRARTGTYGSTATSMRTATRATSARSRPKVRSPRSRRRRPARAARDHDRPGRESMVRRNGREPDREKLSERGDRRVPSLLPTAGAPIPTRP